MSKIFFTKYVCKLHFDKKRYFLAISFIYYLCINTLKDLAEKLFNLSLVDSDKLDDESQETKRLNSSDELPLYTEFVEKALNTNSNVITSSKGHIRLNIEWRSYEDISKYIF